MRRVEVTGSGDWRDVVRLAEASDPEPGPDEVVLAVLAAPISPADLLMIAGRYGKIPAFPYTPGAECVGRVDRVGASVEGFAVGDLAMPMPGLGCWAEKAVHKAALIRKLPPDIDVRQAAMIKANPATAKLMLDTVPLQRGDWVIQNAANSAVGRYVIQLAHRRGVRTLNVVRRPELAQDLRALGADVVVSSENGGGVDWLDRIEGVRPRLALDAVGGASTRQLAARLEKGGRLLCYGLLGGDPVQIDTSDLVFRGVTVCGFWLAQWFARAKDADVDALYNDLVDLVASGELRASVEGTYPLEQWRDALAHTNRGRRSGKILFAPDRP